MDKAIAQGSTGDEAEAMTIEQLRELGADVLTDWGQQKQSDSLQKERAQNPRAINHIKKVKWLTTYGLIEVEEQVLRLGRRGPELRPFCVRAGVRNRACSLSLQRAIVDFGAEGAFAPASRRVREHYGIDVSVSAIRNCTLKHGKAMAMTAEKAAPRLPAKMLVTQMDGSMVPMAQAGSGPDRRKGKKVYWREARLCCARSLEAVEPFYGATLGSVEVAGLLWGQTARLSGRAENTYVHGVGDGAGWINAQFQENFGRQGAYLLDLHHVSDYLVAAGTKVARPGQEKKWRRQQQARLLTNRYASVLRTLERHLEPAGVKEAPVRAAHRYLQERSGQLDYAGARAKGLPVGSGEIESGHRHVIQHRLKIAGGWWTERNAESMLQMRVARANHWWDAYWAAAKN